MFALILKMFVFMCLSNACCPSARDIEINFKTIEPKYKSVEPDPCKNIVFHMFTEIFFVKRKRFLNDILLERIF